ncbi:gp99 [Corynebacterium phage P1201]|uniref:Gp99 n=1 Tax=Corynebacterium phage P1201 TaxID=384848 RepID=A7IYG6_9CAUD|nr:gp99 [Corynebacterium phage P1201]ABF57549.1 gp99 [Corynebacterium phage P1201]
MSQSSAPKRRICTPRPKQTIKHPGRYLLPLTRSENRMSVFHGDGEMSVSTTNAALQWNSDTPFHSETKTYDAMNATFINGYLSSAELSQFLADSRQGMEDS